VRVGVIALQGGFAEHITMLSRLGADALPVRLPSQLDGLGGIVIPGGESTTLQRLMSEYALIEPIRELAGQGLPVWGTCAGMVLLASKADNPPNGRLGLINIEIERNAFGRQVDSFESDLSMPVLGDRPFPGVFIRAPLIRTLGDGVQVLCQLPSGAVVAAREDNRLVCSFHPELTDDSRFHEYFLSLDRGDAFKKSSH
jgi:pyridoxal 5'-phosphate synthase pdxT subunit